MFSFNKKVWVSILSSLMICLMSINISYASNIDLKRLTIDVAIQEDGSAHIQENWNIDVDEGTEIYKVFDNMGDSRISNFKVYDHNGQAYDYISDWDIEASKEEKDGKCGIIQNGDHYELCFGIGDYGHNQYTFEYDVSAFVQQYQNDQGFNYAFFSEMDFPIQSAQITISSPYEFNASKDKIWAFGYYGTARFEDGKVVMESNVTMDDGEKMQLLMRIENGTFSNAHPNDQSFDDILADAKEGSSYNDSDYERADGSYSSFIYEDYTAKIMIGAIVSVSVITALVLICYRLANRGKIDYRFTDNIPLHKDVNMFRDIPCHKDVFEFYYLAKELGLIDTNDRSGLISALILKWIRDKKIVFEKQESGGLIFKKSGYRMSFNDDVVVDHPLEVEFLDYLKQAAGADGILETKEFENWCSDHYEKIDDYFDKIDSYIREQYRKASLLSYEVTYTSFLFIKVSHDTDVYDPSIRESMEYILGFKSFLEEMSSIDEKEVIEVVLWEEYLIFASILGLAETVEKELGRLCPHFNEYSQLDTMHTTPMVYHFASHSMSASFNAAHDASVGLGGSSSFGGGGGGFSGGGGGGVR